MCIFSNIFELIGNLKNFMIEIFSMSIWCRTLLKTHHLEFNLKTERLLFDGCHACGEGLPHAGGPTHRELRDALQSGDGAGHNRSTAGAAHKHPADALPVRIIQ